MVCTECGSSVEFFSHEVDQSLGAGNWCRHHYTTTRHTLLDLWFCFRSTLLCPARRTWLRGRSKGTRCPSPVLTAPHAHTAAYCPGCWLRGCASAPSSAREAPWARLRPDPGGCLAYFLSPAIAFLVEPYNKNRFVRFHSFQCLVLCLVGLVVGASLRVVGFLLFSLPGSATFSSGWSPCWSASPFSWFGRARGEGPARRDVQAPAGGRLCRTANSCGLSSRPSPKLLIASGVLFCTLPRSIALDWIRGCVVFSAKLTCSTKRLRGTSMAFCRWCGDKLPMARPRARRQPAGPQSHPPALAPEWLTTSPECWPT